MTEVFTLGAVLLVPLCAFPCILLCRRSPNLRDAVSLVFAAILFCATAALLPVVAQGARPGFELFQVFPGFAIGFRAEPLGVGFALIVSFLWFFTVLYAIGYMRAHGERNQTRFFGFFALAIAATVAAAFADNLLSLYLFYEALTLATYPLVTHGGKDEDRAGGRTYLLILLGTSLVFLLLAMAWTQALAGTLNFTPGGVFLRQGVLIDGVTPGLLAVLFALFVFGTGKAALMPFHRWLPAAMVAPTPVSALLHAVAVVKLGVFVILKVTVYIFGLEALTRFNATYAIQFAAAATLLLAAVLAIREDNLKRRLAYSTVSQLAYIVLAATLASTLSLAAGSMHIAAHALAKITLFFCAGMILVSLHKTTVSEFDGIARSMPITLTAWVVASLCVIGLPLTGGFWSKWYLAQSALAAGQPLVLGVILLGSVLAVGYLLPPAVRAFYPSTPQQQAVVREPGTAEAPRTCLLAIMVTATLSVALFFCAQPMLRFLGHLTS